MVDSLLIVKLFPHIFRWSFNGPNRDSNFNERESFYGVYFVNKNWISMMIESKLRKLIDRNQSIWSLME